MLIDCFSCKSLQFLHFGTSLFVLKLFLNECEAFLICRSAQTFVTCYGVFLFFLCYLFPFFVQNILALCYGVHAMVVADIYCDRVIWYDERVSVCYCHSITLGECTIARPDTNSTVQSPAKSAVYRSVQSRRQADTRVYHTAGGNFVSPCPLA